MRLRKWFKYWIRRHGYEVRKLALGEIDDLTRLVRLTQSFGINTFLDVGANQGQFVNDLRAAGYTGRTISFEPLDQAHRELRRRAAGDHQWTVADRLALGRSPGFCTINVSQNSFSSSLLPMGDRHLKSAPSSMYVGAETVRVERLDDVLPKLAVRDSEPLSLKIDTQGYEIEVLGGSEETIRRVKVLYTELALAPLYIKGPSFDDVYGYLRTRGYRCVALSHEFSDPKTGEMLQVNGTFIRE